MQAGSPTPFVRDVPPAVAQLLRAAAAASLHPNRAEQLLWTAHALAPRCLGVHFALYKFYFSQRALPEAERAARLALREAAAQAGFDADWTRATRTSANWRDALGPEHFYLFSLKALAFICLRSGKEGEARAILAKLAEIDVEDCVGASVIRDIAAAIET